MHEHLLVGAAGDTVTKIAPLPTATPLDTGSSKASGNTVFPMASSLPGATQVDSERRGQRTIPLKLLVTPMVVETVIGSEYRQVTTNHPCPGVSHSSRPMCSPWPRA
jgi:hypothetical protein